MRRPFQITLLAAALLASVMATPAFATIVYTNGQNRSTPITTTETLQVDNTDSATQSGAITGVGLTIIKSGIGRLILSGTSTYSGDTFINGGELRAGTSTALSNASTYSVASGALLDINGFDTAVEAIAGTGKISSKVMFGNGTIPILTVGSNNTSSTFNGVIESGFGGSIGPIGLAKNGTGTLTLGGPNTYTGTTTVNSGILKLGADDAFSRSSVTTIKAGAILDFDGHTTHLYKINLDGGTVRNGTVSMAGQSGASQLISTGGTIENVTYENVRITAQAISGTTYMVGSNVFSIDVGSGVLDFSRAVSSPTTGVSGVSASAGGIIELGGTTQYFYDAYVSTGGIITNGNINITHGNMGSLAVRASGGTINGLGGTTGVDATSNVSTLRGTNTYSGPTHVTTGYISGTLVGGSENAFSPNSDMTVDVDATLDLGGYHQTVKSLTLNGARYLPPLAPSPGISILVVGLSDAAPALTVTGNATLGGRLVLNFPATTMLPQYTVIKAGSITGEFATVTTNAPPGFAFGNLVYSPTDVKINLIVEDTSKLPAPSSLTTTTSTSFDSSTHASDVVFDHLGDTGSGSESNTDNLTFVSLRDTQVTHAENTQGINALAKALPAVMKRNGGWFKAMGNLGSVSSNSAAAGYETQTGGFMFGMDREVEKDLRIGAAGGYEHTGITGYTATRSNGEANTVRFALYGSKGWNDITLDGQMGYAHHDIENARTITPALTANSNHVAHEISAGMQVSKRLKLNGFGITPRVGANYAYVYEDAFSETNAGISNISVAARANNLLRLYTGLNFTAPTRKIGEYAFTPNARVKYSYDVFNASNNTQATIIGTAASLQGVSAARHALAVGVGFDLKLNETFSAFGSYDMTTPIGNRFDQTFVAGLRFSF